MNPMGENYCGAVVDSGKPSASQYSGHSVSTYSSCECLMFVKAERTLDFVVVVVYAVTPRHNWVADIRIMREQSDTLHYGLNMTITAECEPMNSEVLLCYFGL